MGMLYAAVVWFPVLGSLYENIRGAWSGQWHASDWVIMLVFWVVGSFLWMGLCDWAMRAIGVWRGWWPKDAS